MAFILLKLWSSRCSAQKERQVCVLLLNKNKLKQYITLICITNIQFIVEMLGHAEQIPSPVGEVGQKPETSIVSKTKTLWDSRHVLTGRKIAWKRQKDHVT